MICVHKEENDFEWKNIFRKLSFWREILTKLADQWSQKLGNPAWGQAGIKMETDYFLVILSKSHRWRDIWDTKLSIVIYAVLLWLPSESNLKVLILSTRRRLVPLSICPKMHFALASLAKKVEKVVTEGGYLSFYGRKIGYGVFTFTIGSIVSLNLIIGDASSLALNFCTGFGAFQ